MEPEQLLKNSAVGAKWTLGLSLAVMPLSYATNIILARISPEALGTYGFLAVLISVVAAFFMFGGSQVIVRFLPQLAPEKKSAFLFSYAVLALGVASIFLSLVLLSPTAEFLRSCSGSTQAPMYSLRARTIRALA